jgi:hypothetical protein
MSVHKDINTNEHNSLSQTYKVLDIFVPLGRYHAVKMYKMHTHILAFGIRLKQVGCFKLSQGKISVMHWLKAWRRPTIILDMTVKKISWRNQTILIMAKARNFTGYAFPRGKEVQLKSAIMP